MRRDQWLCLVPLNRLIVDRDEPAHSDRGEITMRRAPQVRTTWLGRSLRGHRPDRNPLRRRTDRVESAILAVLIAAFCIGSPLLGYEAVTVTHSTSLRELQAQHASSHQVRATLLEVAVSIDAYPVITGPEADARWIAPDGKTVQGVVPTAVDAQAGSTVLIWTDRSGHLVTPLQADMIGARESIAALGAVTSLGAALMVTGLLARWALNRRQLTAWDVDWQATEPRWTSRH
jgi:hypothetical protein